MAGAQAEGAMVEEGQNRAKRAAAEAAAELVQPGMKLGLGTGSTAAILVDILGARYGGRADAPDCVATSARTRAQAEALGLPVRDLDTCAPLDLTIDGADEVDGAMRLIKGGGGALLQEKIVAAASARMVVIADESKAVAALGAFPLPVEIVRFGWETTARAVAAVLERAAVAARDLRLRGGAEAPFRTDEGHYILDLGLGRIDAPEALDADLRAVPGVVETGLFLGLATGAIFGAADGTIRRA